MATERIKNVLNELNLDFVKYRYIAAFASVITVLAAWMAFFVYPGPRWGIDFTGGTEIQMEFKQDVHVDEIREGLAKLGLSEDSVQQYGDPSKHVFNVRIDDATFGVAEAKADVQKRFVDKYGAAWVKDVAMDAEVGARVTVTYVGDKVSIEDVRPLFADVTGVVVREGIHENQIVVQLPGLSQEIEHRIRTALPDREFQVVQAESVGPKVGEELRTQAFMAIAITIGMVLLYIAFRFDLTFAPGAVLALVHDTSVIAGAFVLFDKEFNLSIIGAILTVIGYSLNDTVIVYDRLRENREKYRRVGTRDLINRSVNETLTRTISTSGATMLAIAPFLVMGGPVLSDFAFAMFLGIIVGTYSTIYVASPMILVMEEVKPYLDRWVVSASGATGATASMVVPPVGGSSGGAATAGDPGQPDATSTMTESEKRRRERAERERQAQKDQSRTGR
jgi:preprotein translocase subunit SecF